MMNAINYRAFSRTIRKTSIHFAESMTVEYRRARLLNESSGGMSFVTQRQLKVGSTIFIKRSEAGKETNGAKPYRKDLAEVRWCVGTKDKKRARWKVGVKLFSAVCALCGAEIHYHDPDDLIDLCEECQSRFSELPKGKMKAVLEDYLLGNVI